MQPVAAGLLVFFTSFIVLVLEILGSRLLAPYIGVTLQTYTAVIGTVLTGISLGTWIGGTVADRWSPQRLLGPIIAVGGLCVLLTVPVARWLGPDLGGRGAALTVVLSFLTLFFPAALLSAVNPTVVKRQLSSLEATGRTVGRLSALATAGAILGTFATGFFLVATFPVARVLAGSGMALVAVGMLLTLIGLKARAPLVVPLVLMLIVSASLTDLTVRLRSPCVVESSYFCIQVLNITGQPNVKVLKLDDYYHSEQDMEDPTNLRFAYLRALASVVDHNAANAAPINVLSVGAGAFTLPRYIAATHPQAQNDVLEIDPALVDVDKKYFGVVTSDKLRAYVGDARTRLPKLAPAGYDFVLGDAFGGESVPWQLTTVEFDRQIAHVLKSDGIYAMNMIDFGPLDLIRAQVKTLKQVFTNVVMVAVNTPGSKQVGGNFVLLATNRAFDAGVLPQWLEGQGAFTVMSGADLDQFVGGARVLTDDFAPVDQLITTVHTHNN